MARVAEIREKEYLPYGQSKEVERARYRPDGPHKAHDPMMR